MEKRYGTSSGTYSRKSVARGHPVFGPTPLVLGCPHDLTIQEVSSKPACDCVMVIAKCDLCGEIVTLANANVQSRYFDEFRLKWPVAKE